jgi:hypothetical protein
MKKGIFILISAIAVLYLGSCKKETEDPDLVGRSSFYGFLDGYSLSCLEGQYGSAGSGALIFPIDTDSSMSSFSSYLSNQNFTLTLNRGILRYFGTGAAPLSAFKAYFPVANIGIADTVSSGMQIGYIDYRGETWSTNWGPQSDGYFKITKNESSTASAKVTLNIEAEFKCRVYNKKGNMHVLKGTKFRGNFTNI